MTTSEHNHSDSGESDSICSSLGYAFGIDHDLPSWLSGREVWTIEIAHWNDTPPGSIFLVYKFGRGQDDITMGNVLRKMIDKLGGTFNKRAIVSLMSTENSHSVRLDDTGCYDSLRLFLHKCSSSHGQCRDHKIKLHYHLNADEIRT